MKNIAENFNFYEAIKSRTAENNDIDNIPYSFEIIDNILFTARNIQAVRDLLNKPVIVTSWFRCELLNILIGGSKTSDHLLGYAVDFICPKFGTNYDICRAIDKSDIEYDQLICENRGDKTWVHISFKRKANRRMLLTYKDGDYYNGLV